MTLEIQYLKKADKFSPKIQIPFQKKNQISLIILHIKQMLWMILSGALKTA